MKLPALHFYIGDWRKDPGVQSLSFEEKGVWIELLFLMHESEQRGKLVIGGKAISEDRLSTMLHLDKQKLSSVLSSLLELNVADREPNTGIIFSRRMVRDEEIRQIRSECGKMGGNPGLVKQKKLVKQKSKQNSEDEDEDEFTAFYQKYPRKEKPADAKKAWNQVNGVKFFFEIMAALEWQVQLPNWIKENGQYVPLPASYLRAESWKNQPMKQSLDALSSHDLLLRPQ